MRIYMQIPSIENKPPRYYQLVLLEDMLEGWTLIREWGNLGSAGRVKRDHFSDYASAQAAMLRVRDTQIDRGYKVVFMQGQETPHE